MNTPDFNDLWNASDADAQAHYLSIRDRLERSVKRQSQSVLHRVMRNAIAELLVVIVMCGFLIYIAHKELPHLWPAIVFSVVAIGFSAWLYLRLLQQIKGVQFQSVRQHLETQVEILGGFVRRLRAYVVYLMPVSLVVGSMMSAYKSGPFDEAIYYWKSVGLATLIGLPIVAILMWWTLKFYIHALYGKPLKELRELLGDVVESEDSRDSAD